MEKVGLLELLLDDEDDSLERRFSAHQFLNIIGWMMIMLSKGNVSFCYAK